MEQILNIIKMLSPPAYIILIIGATVIAFARIHHINSIDFGSVKIVFKSKVDEK